MKTPPASRRLLIIAILALLVPAACAEKRTPAPKKQDQRPVVLAYLSGLYGNLEPCGCTSNPLGGLDRIAAHIAELQKSYRLALVVVGNTFYDPQKGPAHLLEQAEQRADTIAAWLQKLKPLAIAAGPNDLSESHRARVLELAKRYQLPLLQGPYETPSGRLADSSLHQIGPLTLSFIGASGSVEAEAESYSTAARKMWRARADVVVGLTGLLGKKVAGLARGIKGVTVILGTTEGENQDPLVEGGSLVALGKSKGQYLGLIRFYPKKDPRYPQRAYEWVFNDENRKKKKSLGDRMEAMKARIKSMEPGLAREARAQRLAKLEAELKGMVPQTPQGSFMTWSAHPMDKSLTPPGWAKAMLASYNRSLCASSLAATADRECEAAPDPKNHYVGTERCAACHPDDLKVHQQTKHATAWKTLTDAGKECDLGCIGCHSVGFEKPGGYCRLEDAEKNKNVGCENCHGPGGGHAKSPFKKEDWGSLFVAKPGEAICVECHNKEHSDLFDFKAYLPRVLGPGHGLPLEK